MAPQRISAGWTWMKWREKLTTSNCRSILKAYGEGSWKQGVDSSMEPQSHQLLTTLQHKFIHVFAQIPDHSFFYLTGGTALAEYYLGHRLSYDLDFFTAEDGLIQPVSFQFEELVKKSDLQVNVVRRLTSYVEWVITDDDDVLKVDLALDSPYRFQDTVFCPPGIWVNNYEDLSVDKTLAYYGRAEPRDAVDLFFILKNLDHKILFEKAKQKDPGFDLYWFAIALNRSLNFPDEPERWPVNMLMEWNPKEIKGVFSALAIEIMDGL
jgi:hypothetical protein